MTNMMFAFLPLFLLLLTAHGFQLTPSSTRGRHASCSSLNDAKGDPLREATGIRPSLHPVTINAIAEALKIRAQNKPDMPLKHSSEVEDWEVMYAAGKVAQEAIKKRQQASQQDGMVLDEEEESIIGGRIVAVILRFDYLEEILAKRCEQVEWIAKYNEYSSFGLLKDESDSTKVDEQILADALFGTNRAECLLAIFLDVMEGPAMKKSGDIAPGGSEADFLDSDRKEVLLATTKIDDDDNKEKDTEDDPATRPSLHPIAINAVADALKLRAEKKRFSPLRLLEGVDDFRVMVTASRVAEGAIQKRQRASQQDGILRLEPAEEQLVGGRIVATILRFDELEEQLHKRCQTSEWISKNDQWSTFGVLQDENDFEPIDQKVLEDPLFAVSRAEGLLALLLHEIEGPTLKHSGEPAPDGSKVDFLDNDRAEVLLVTDA